MNGKSILSAMGRHTPEHSSVMTAAGSGATTSPSSSRTSSLRSGMGQHTPGGCHQLPCTQVKASEVSSNALNPNTGPARSPVSPKLSPGDLAALSHHLPSLPSSKYHTLKHKHLHTDSNNLLSVLKILKLEWVIKGENNSELFLNRFFQLWHGVFFFFFQKGASLRNICCSVGVRPPTTAPSCNRPRWSFWRTSSVTSPCWRGGCRRTNWSVSDTGKTVHCYTGAESQGWYFLLVPAVVWFASLTLWPSRGSHGVNVWASKHQIMGHFLIMNTLFSCLPTSHVPAVWHRWERGSGQLCECLVSLSHCWIYALFFTFHAKTYLSKHKKQHVATVYSIQYWLVVQFWPPWNSVSQPSSALTCQDINSTRP